MEPDAPQKGKKITLKGKRYIVGRPMIANAGISAFYQRILGRATRSMVADTQKALKGVTDVTGAETAIVSARVRYAPVFEGIAQNAARQMVSQTSGAVAANLSASRKTTMGDIGKAIRISASSVSKERVEVTKAAVAGNVGLIKSIPDQYFDRINETVMRAIMGGEGVREVYQDIQNIGHSTQKRASLIAQDQVMKANSALSVSAMKEAGVKKFMWRHSHGGQTPRESHVKMDGQVYDIDNPPIIDENTGERGYPGQLIHCRCVALPVFEDWS